MNQFFLNNNKTHTCVYYKQKYLTRKFGFFLLVISWRVGHSNSLIFRDKWNQMINSDKWWLYFQIICFNFFFYFITLHSSSRFSILKFYYLMSMYCNDSNTEFYNRCDHLSECTVLKFRDQKLFIIYEKNGKKFIKFIMFIEHHIREKASLKLLFAFNMFKMTCFSQNKKIAHTMWLSIKDLWQNLIIVNPVQFYIFI